MLPTLGRFVVEQAPACAPGAPSPDLHIRLHLDSLRAHGEAIPEPSAVAATIVEVA